MKLVWRHRGSCPNDLSMIRLRWTRDTKEKIEINLAVYSCIPVFRSRLGSPKYEDRGLLKWSLFLVIFQPFRSYCTPCLWSLVQIDNFSWNLCANFHRKWNFVPHDIAIKHVPLSMLPLQIKVLNNTYRFTWYNFWLQLSHAVCYIITPCLYKSNCTAN